jgi:uncharacterized membrane-anchored protein
MIGFARRFSFAALASLILAGFTALSSAQTNTNILNQLQAVKALAATLQPQSGKIALKNGLATINLPDNFRYLSADDTATVLFKIWGNPPGPKPLGMIVPDDFDPLANSSWAVIVTYDDDGYVKDEDADKIDYAKLLKQMQDGVHAENKERVENHYPPIELVGWAAPPVYDKASHKMYWAKEISFGGAAQNTLNYNIRVLGRHGVLVLNAIASMRDFAEIQKHVPDVVKMADFADGNRYADFNHSTDKVAAYGLAALVLGGIAAKAGLFKVILIGLVAAKKFIIIGVAAAASYFRKFFKRKPPAQPPTPTI